MKISLRKKVKTNAHRAVTQNYIRCLCVTLILASVVMLLALLAMVANLVMEFLGVQLPWISGSVLGNWNYISSPIIVLVSLLVEWILLAPLLLGAAWWYYRLCGGESCEVIDLFDCFSGVKRYFGALWLEANLFVRRLLWTLVFLCVPESVCLCGMAILSGKWMAEELSVQVTSIIGGLLLIAGGVLFFAAAIFSAVFLKRYALARYLYVSEEGCGVRKSIKQSVYFMKNRKSELFVFDLSYIGWLMLCVFIIPAFYVIPYYMASRALYARVLIETNQRAQETASFSD